MKTIKKTLKPVLPTVSIGIPAYNEKDNIKNLLEKLLKQKLVGASLRRIIVLSDGSTDHTVEKARKVKDKRLVVVSNSKRLGLNMTQNKILDMVNEDILVLLDADIIPANNNFLQEIVKPILDDKRVGLVGANVESIPAKSFFEKIIVGSHAFKTTVYRQINNMDNLFLCHGRARAFAKSYYKTLQFPSNVPEDSFSYLKCKMQNYKFVYAHEAKVLFRSPTNFNDHMKQSFRFKDSPEKLKKYFPAEFVDRNYSIPLGILLKQFLLETLRMPVTMISYVIINYYIGWKKRKVEINHVVYDPSVSTKNLGVKI